MADKTDNNDSLDTSFEELGWMSSTPISTTKFNSALDETLKSEYKSALSAIFTNPKKSLSTIGTKGSTNTSDSEFSSPTSLTDDETEKEKLDGNTKYINFESDDVTLKKDISWNIDKILSFEENVYKRSSSTIGTKGSTNASYSELSSPKFLTDDEIENTNQEEHGDCSKDNNFDEDVATVIEKISLITEKDQNSIENVYKTTWRNDNRISNVIPDLQYCKSEKDSFSEQTNDNSDVYEINRAFGKIDVSKICLEGEEIISDVIHDFQSCKIEKESLPEQTGESSNIYDFASYRSTSEQNAETFNEESTLGKEGKSDKNSSRIFVSSPIDLEIFQRSPTSLNVSPTMPQRKVQENISPTSDPFCRKRRKLDRSNQAIKICIFKD